MKYNYVPDTYDRDLIKEKFKDDDEFLKCQLEYKKAFESILNKVYDFKSIDKKVNSIGFVPKPITDANFFYHQTSTLQNNYVFLRNNFHVERLDKEDIENLKNGIITQDLFNRTLLDVIFEGGDATFIGKPIKKNLVKSKSLYFEFGYDVYEVDDYEFVEQIENIRDQVFEEIEEALKGKIEIPISFITNNSLSTMLSEDGLTTTQDFIRPSIRNEDYINEKEFEESLANLRKIDEELEQQRQSAERIRKELKRLGQMEIEERIKYLPKKLEKN